MELFKKKQKNKQEQPSPVVSSGGGSELDAVIAEAQDSQEKTKKPKKKMSSKTKILFLIIIFLGIAILYYLMVYRTITDGMAQYNIENLETEMTNVQAKVGKYNNMKKFIDEYQGSDFGTVEKYSNLSNEISEIGKILNDASNVAVTWTAPTLTGKIVRRGVQIRFETSEYPKVMDYLAKLRTLKYRFLFTDVQISAKSKETFATTSTISVVSKGVIYETIDENSNLDGLVIVAEKK